MAVALVVVALIAATVRGVNLGLDRVFLHGQSIDLDALQGRRVLGLDPRQGRTGAYVREG
jgi:hypothetical protein